jgi:hypothetical protein
MLTAVGSSVGAAVGEAVGSSVGDCKAKGGVSALSGEVETTVLGATHGRGLLGGRGGGSSRGLLRRSRRGRLPDRGHSVRP